MAEPSASQIQSELKHVYDDRGPDLLVSCALCLSLAYVAVVLRFVARHISRAGFKADDWWIVVSLALATVLCVSGIVGVHLGMGRHITLVKNPSNLVKNVVAFEILYSMGAATFKFSVLFLYLRLFGSTRNFAILCWAIGIFTFVYSACGAMVALFQCNPIRRVWDMTVPGTCLNPVVAAIVPGVINALTDIIVVLLPIPLIWNLQMQRKWKLQIVGIFLLSSFLCIGSIYRVTTTTALSHLDASWADVDCGIWAMVEVCIGIVSASLPTMRPIYNLIVRGHHCTSYDAQCSRCEDSRASGSRARWRMPTKWPGSASSQSSSGDEASAVPKMLSSDLESAEKSQQIVSVEVF